MTLPPVAVVVITKDRKGGLMRTVERLLALPEQPRLVVVDNHSSDGSMTDLRVRFPEVVTVPLPANDGSAGRNAGVRLAACDYVAFADDDSWWEPGALREAVSIMERNPAIGLVAARVLVGDEARLDPTCEAMERGRVAANLDEADGSGDGAQLHAVTGCMACGSVVRSRAFLAVGGFAPGLMVGGEEQMLVWDLLASGWRAVYAPTVVVRHFPEPRRRASWDRRRLVTRNDLWTAWARLPARSAARRTAEVIARGRWDPAAWSGVAGALRRAGWALSRRSAVPERVDWARRQLAAPWTRLPAGRSGPFGGGDCLSAR